MNIKLKEMQNFLRIIFFCFTLLAVNTGLKAQQLPNSSHIGETRAIWNPALTAPNNDMIVDGFFRMQWLGFQGAPLSGFASCQYPFVKQNMSVGGFLNVDKTGPVSKIGMQLNYAYKLKEVFSKYGQLSLGVSANFQQYSYNGAGAIYNDFDDGLINNSRVSSFFPAAGMGFFYTTNIREYTGNAFFIGAGINQLFTTEVLVNDFDQTRQKHIHFNVGGRIGNYDSYIEPMITANMVEPGLIDVLYSLRYELENAFWAGVGFSNVGMASIQSGVILDRFGNRYAKLRLGVLANYGLTSTLAKAGPGMEIYVAYNFNLK